MRWIRSCRNSSTVAGRFNLQPRSCFGHEWVLTAQAGGEPVAPISCTVNRGRNVPTPLATEAVLVWMPDLIVPLTLAHELSEVASSVSYCITPIAGSKTVVTVASTANLMSPEFFEGAVTEIGLWEEFHHYATGQGSCCGQWMSPVTVPTVPQQGPYFQSRQSILEFWAAPFSGLKGVARIEVLAFGRPDGPLVWPWVVMNREVDQTIPAE